MSDVVKLYDPSQVVESAIDSYDTEALISTDRTMGGGILMAKEAGKHVLI